VISADGDAMEASVQAVFDEYERVRRFGFTDAEVERAVSTLRAEADSRYEGRDSRQDAEFADDYAQHVLTGDPIPTADAAYDLVTEILDRATPETVAFGFVDRLASTGAHMMVVVPEAEAAAVPDAEVFLTQARSMRDRDLEPRGDEAGIEGDLMVPPDPVEEASRSELSDGRTVSFVAPQVLEFDNGVTVSLNVTDIVEGQVAFEARSPGGSSTVADADVGAADAAGIVVTTSGVATYDQVTLEDYLAEKDVVLDIGMDVFTEGMAGSAATADLEVLFQLVHLYMTQPRVDQRAVEQYVDDELPYAADPSIDPSYAEFAALLDARYDDPRYLLPSVESLNAVTADDVDRVFRDRFGDASDFSFAFSGDFDVEEAVDLARRYLGTLPATGRTESVDFVEPPPPEGVVTTDVAAGEGEQAIVSFLFTAPATADRRDDVTALLLQEVVGNRLNDTIREELGDSYSPFAIVEVGSGGSPAAETYLANTTGPELVVEVEQAVLAELDDLRRNGPTDTEYDAAAETVEQQLDLFSNEQINDEVLDVFTDPAGAASFDDFLEQAFLVDDISAADLRDAIASWLPADRFIVVRVLPR
jgi:zinc protease